MKTLKKSKLKEAKHIEHTKTERKILEIVNHPFIVSLKFAFQTEKKLYFVMDYHNGGELFYHLRSKGKFSETQAKFYLLINLKENQVRFLVPMYLSRLHQGT